jgi:indolepyruvate ferredoxin oxidoreductase
LGDSIYSNMMTFGAAWQMGLVPLSREAIKAAIKMNGAAVEANKQAFEMGRWAVENPERVKALTEPNVVALPKSLDEKIAFREAQLVAYQGKRLAKRFRKMVDGVSDRRLKEAVAKGYHKLLSYKDEYEVARLHLETEAKARESLTGDFKVTYHLAPPLLPGRDSNGRPKKRAFGAWVGGVYKVLAKMKVLRGTPFDVFGYSADRRMERELIRQYQDDMLVWLPKANAARMDALVALAELPLSIRGFGPVKEANAKKAEARRRELLLALEGSDGTLRAAE